MGLNYENHSMNRQKRKHLVLYLFQNGNITIYIKIMFERVANEIISIKNTK